MNLVLKAKYDAQLPFLSPVIPHFYQINTSKHIQSDLASPEGTPLILKLVSMVMAGMDAGGSACWVGSAENTVSHRKRPVVLRIKIDFSKVQLCHSCKQNTVHGTTNSFNCILNCGAAVLCN